MIRRTVAFFLLVFGFSLVGKSQVESARVLGAYTYNFARYTTWPNEANLSHFGIMVICTDEKIRQEFRSFSASRTIKDKPIQLQLLTAVPEKIDEDIQLLVLPGSQVEKYESLYRLIDNRPILLVSENYPDKSRVMINLYTSGQQVLLFEVNKANVYNHHLSIDPEILLMGGTEIDVIALYRGTQDSLDLLSARFKHLADSLKMLNQTINQSLVKVEEQRLALLVQQEQLTNQELELQSGKQSLIEQNKAIIGQQKVMQQQQNELNHQTRLLEQQKDALEEQQAFINFQKANIERSKETLDSLMSEITDRNLELASQSSIIDRQKLTTLLAVLSGVLAILILAILIVSFLKKVKKNALLTKQKEEIIEMNRKLKSTNKSLFHTLGQLKETQSQLVSSEKMASLGILTAGIAHEINNPVNFIYTGINSLKNDYEDISSILQTIKDTGQDTDPLTFRNEILKLRDKSDLNEIMEIIPQTIDDIRVGAERTADIIRGLRNFSRIDADTWQEANIHEGLDSALLLLRNKFKNQIKVEKHYAQLPKIECYPGKLNQVFLNVLSNAIDAIEHDGTISITTRMKGVMVQIEIADTGKGINKENVDKIFDPFFTTKTVGAGVGLGLSITFGIVKDHNGLIEVKSEENKGTVFTILLPCKHNQ